MSEIITNNHAPDSAAAYRAAYDRQFALAPKELQAKLVEARTSNKYDKDKDVTSFIQSVASEAEAPLKKI